MFTQESKQYVANIILSIQYDSEELVKVTGCYVRCKSGNISEMILDVNTVQWKNGRRYTVFVYANFSDLECHFSCLKALYTSYLEKDDAYQTGCVYLRIAKRIWHLISTVVSKLGSQVVTYTVKVVIAGKCCEIKLLNLLETINRQ